MYKFGLGIIFLSLFSPAQAVESVDLSERPSLENTVVFPIRGIEITGARLLPAATLQSVVRPYIGEQKTLQDLIGAQKAIQKAYDRAGFQLVSVGLPQQVPLDGQITIVVSEISLGKVKVSGNQYFSTESTRAALPALKEGQGVDFSALDRQLLLANDNSSRRLNVAFSNGQNLTSDVTIETIEQKPLKIGVNIDNTGTHETGIARLGVTAIDDNLFGLGHSVTLSYTTSAEKIDKVSQLGAFYQIPWPLLGDKINLSASYSNVNSGRIANIFNVSGQGTTYGMHYVHAISRSLSSNHYVDFGLDRQQFKNVIDFNGINVGQDVDAMPFSIGYQFVGTFPWRGQLSTNLTYFRNLPGGSLNNNETYNLSRFGATANWHAFRANTRYAQSLPGNWQASFRLEQQYTNAPLISGEQIGAGGMRSVRGFAERELSGDRGSVYSLELMTPPIADSHQLLAFLDGAKVSRLNVANGVPPSDIVQSYGIGWRFISRLGPTASLDFATINKGTEARSRASHMLHFASSWWF